MTLSLSATSMAWTVETAATRHGDAAPAGNLMITPPRAGGATGGSLDVTALFTTVRALLAPPSVLLI